MTNKIFKDEKEMRATLIEKRIEESVRMQMLDKKIDEMEREDNPDRYDSLVRLKDRLTSSIEKAVARKSFPRVMDALLPY